MVLCLGITAWAQAVPEAANSLVLFDFAISAGEEAAKNELVIQHAADLGELIGEGLLDNKNLAVVKYDHRLACIQRAVREQKIDEKDVQAAIDTDRAGAIKAQKLTNLMGAHYALIGSIDKYTAAVSQGKPTVEITATLQLIDSNSGRVVHAFGASGRAAQTEAAESESALGTIAVYDLAEKFLGDICDVTLTAATEQSYSAPNYVQQTGGGKSKKGLLPAMLGALLIGLLIGK